MTDPRQRWLNVINKAIAYEEAWNAYAHPRPLHKNREAEAEAHVAKAHAHQALLEAVRALREDQP